MRTRLGPIVPRLRQGAANLIRRVGNAARRVGGAIRRAVSRGRGRSSAT